MAFSDIKADPNILRELVAKSDESKSDSELQALQYETAVSQLKDDLIFEIGIDDDITDTLDYIYSTYTERLKAALAYKQLELYYRKNSDGAGSAADVLQQDYGYTYRTYRNKFKSMEKSSSVQAATTKKIYRG